MGALTRALDWSSTSLGPPARWPQSLRTALGIVLHSRYPMFIFWGPDLIQICNDAFLPVLGAKHPWALGRPAQEVWTEVWPDVGPLVEKALKGESTWAEDLMLFVNRHDFLEEVYFTFSYSPIADEGGNGGMFCACTETTAQVLAARRLLTLSQLAQCATAKSVTEACIRSAEALGRNDHDVPFAVKYLVSEDGGISLSASTGVPAGHPLERNDVAAALLAESGGSSNAGTGVVLELSGRFATLPPGPWPEPPTKAMIMPIIDRTLDRAVALMVFGISARRPFDAGYRTWLGLAAQQIGASMASARAYEQQRDQALALAELDRAKTTFFSNISHEFRTPLTLILGPLEEALNEAPGSDDRERLTLMHRNVLRLQRLVNTLLDFASIEAGRLTARLVPTDLAALTVDLVSAFRAACDRAGIRLRVHAEALRVPVAVDRDMWEKIVLNLMSNALKFTFEGEIVVRVEDSEDGVTVSIRDTGTGISAEQIPRVFERFHRVDGARARTREGSGIGLALVDELVRLN
ncbi:MAG: HAMP domain-containing histidine kinase, partial [Acidobacteria bacterium]|nr:HAMP domain-containing histidine kinase [Acidobacteriota bacterium]